MAQSVKCPTLGFGSGHDLRIRETELFEPCVGLYTVSAGAWDSLSPSLSAPPPPLSK